MTQKEALKPARKRTTWGSYGAFLIAAIGSSIGLGNIWKFPYEAGLHGGGTFLIVYLPSVLLVALPLIVSELMIGRIGKSHPVQSIRVIVARWRLSTLWPSIGWLGMLTSLIIFSYYSVVAGWTLYYVMNSAAGAFENVPAEIVQRSFGALLSNTEQLLIWHSVFVLIVVLVLAQDIRKGLEMLMRFLMPLFIAAVVWLFYFAADVGNMPAALEFMFTVRWEFLTFELFVSALTQALFSMSIGMGILMMYGAYLSDHRPLIGAAVIITVFDTAIALIMSVMIFAIVFAFGMRPDSGAGLIFETLPVAFSQIQENSVWISTTFFSLMFAAALFSGLALLEPAIAWLSERYEMGRRQAAWMVGVIVWAFGLLSIFSYSDFNFAFYYFGVERLGGYFDFFNILSTHVLMPLTALFIALFAGWVISREEALKSLQVRAGISFTLWRLFTRYTAPLFLIITLLMVLFIPA
ncbi:MAG: sodium-dependent transporter [Arenicella sp.]|nr:sodium-dependent transporter [Arenicella sp.]